MLLLSFVHRPSGVDEDKRGASGQGGRAASGAVVRCQTRPGGRRRATTTAVRLRLRVGGRRERRRERRRGRGHTSTAVGQRKRVRGGGCGQQRPRPEVVVAGTGPGHGRGHGGVAEGTRPGGQVVLPAESHTGGAQRRDGHHQRQRTGVPVDSRRRARGGRRSRPAQRSHRRRHSRDAAHRPVVPAPGYPGRAAHRRADRRVQVPSGGLELRTSIGLAPNGRVQ